MKIASYSVTTSFSPPEFNFEYERNLKRSEFNDMNHSEAYERASYEDDEFPPEKIDKRQRRYNPPALDQHLTPQRSNSIQNVVDHINSDSQIAPKYESKYTVSYLN